VPAVAAAAIAVAAVATILIILAAGTSVAFNLFAWSGTVGTLVLLVAYAIFTAGAWYYLCVRGPRQGHRAARLDFIVPVLGLIVLGYTLYRNGRARAGRENRRPAGPRRGTGPQYWEDRADGGRDRDGGHSGCR